jgi:RNA polymerase sigma factor (sigma-70 family)
VERLATEVERNGLTEDDFVELYPRLRRFAAVVGSLDDEPDDLVQEALARIIRLDETPDDAERYLRRTIVNLTVDRGRRRSRWSVRAAKLLDASDHVDHYPSELGLLDTLDPSQRAVLWLADVEGWTFDEIAVLLDVRPTTARKRASRARAQLRDHLEGVSDA